MRGDARWDETWHRLLNWTNDQGPAERLAAQVLLADGFAGLDPSHPLGGKDRGADALAERDGLRWTMAAYFPRGQQSPKTITDKFTGDFEGVAAHHADGMAFVTNQELRLADRRNLAAAVDGPTRIYHLERLVALLDQPQMYGVLVVRDRKPACAGSTVPSPAGVLTIPGVAVNCPRTAEEHDSVNFPSSSTVAL